MHPNHTGIVTACEGVAVPARGAGCIINAICWRIRSRHIWLLSP